MHWRPFSKRCSYCNVQLSKISKTYGSAWTRSRIDAERIEAMMTNDELSDVERQEVGYPATREELLGMLTDTLYALDGAVIDDELTERIRDILSREAGGRDE
jgi:hypothetical protein